MNNYFNIFTVKFLVYIELYKLVVKCFYFRNVVLFLQCTCRFFVLLNVHVLQTFFLFRENYLFTCSCQKCMSQADDADMTSEDDEEAEGEGETEGDDMEDEMTDV